VTAGATVWLCENTKLAPEGIPKCWPTAITTEWESFVVSFSFQTSATVASDDEYAGSPVKVANVVASDPAVRFILQLQLSELQLTPSSAEAMLLTPMRVDSYATTPRVLTHQPVGLVSMMECSTSRVETQRPHRSPASLSPADGRVEHAHDAHQRRFVCMASHSLTCRLWWLCHERTLQMKKVWSRWSAHQSRTLNCKFGGRIPEQKAIRTRVEVTLLSSSVC
jgi:hypothetical protein